jgi:hypothetical protein
MHIRSGCVLLLLLLSVSNLAGQQTTQPASGASYQQVQDGGNGLLESVWLTIRSALLPREFNLAYRLRSWIAQLTPLPHRTLESDLQRLDAIYDRAVYFAEGDAQDALFALSIATLPYHTFPARIPIIDVGITVPVSTESRAVFERRMANLPGKLFADSPAWLDRDKLPHFFGSAWLYLATGMEGVTITAGEALEFGEALFKLEGSRDPRDILINRLGIAFAQQLRKHENVRPSDVLKHGLHTNE